MLASVITNNDNNNSNSNNNNSSSNNINRGKFALLIPTMHYCVVTLSCKRPSRKKKAT